MRLLLIVEALGLGLLGLVLVTQVLLPLWRGGRVFPALRRQGKLESALAGARQAAAEKKLARKVNQVKRER